MPRAHVGCAARALGLLLLAACGPKETLLRIEAGSIGFVAPAQVPAGLTRVRLVNRDSVLHEAVITRIGEGGSIQTYLDLSMTGDENPTFATDLGGPTLVAPGDSIDTLLLLTAGTHAILSWHRDELMRGFIREVRVVPSTAAAAPPRADAEVILGDYTISPITASPGRQLLHVVNRGPSTHEMTIVRLAAGATPEAYHAWRQGGEQGPAPGRPVAGTAALAAGGEAWADVEWEPGEYLVTCAVETVGASPVPRHYTLGMEQRITVGAFAK